MSDATLLVARGMAKSYRRGGAAGSTVPVLEAVDLSVEAGEAVAVQGESGTGKTTLLNLLGGLDRPDSGSVLHMGQPLPDDATERARWRGREVGFIFQFHGLLPELTATENVALSRLIAGCSRRRALAIAAERLAGVGLAARGTHYPAELSGGEQQRVAIARALAGEPSVVLADEPTGNLDPRIGDLVLDQLFAMQTQYRFALVVATHSDRLARRCHRTLRLEAGRLHTSGVAGPPPPDHGAAPRSGDAWQRAEGNPG